MGGEARTQRHLYYNARSARAKVQNGGNELAPLGRPGPLQEGAQTVREGVKVPPACARSSQFSVAASTATNEDCLYLNIFSAEPHDGAPKPVMIWIHPGEFNYGSASFVNPARLSASGEVIVVSLQYRLGALGFMYTGEEDVTNLGLRDQLMAIDWISHNILHFGGDPTRVTLFGSEVIFNYLS